MLRHQVMDALPLLGQDSVVLYLPAPCPLPVAPHDFSRSAELIDLGHATASAFLEGLRIHGAGIHGHPHFHPWRGEVTATGPGGEQALAGQPAAVDRMAGEGQALLVLAGKGGRPSPDSTGYAVSPTPGPSGP